MASTDRVTRGGGVAIPLRACVTLVALAAVQTAGAAPHVRVDARTNGDAELRGLALTVADRVAARLSAVGFEARARPTELGTPSWDHRLAVSVTRGRGELLRVTVEGEGSTPRIALTTESAIESLDRASATLSIGVARAIGPPVDPDEARRWLEAPATSAQEERALALAEDELARGDARRARVRFDGAEEVRRARPSVAALSGVFRASARFTRSWTDKADLAGSSWERAEEARSPAARIRDLSTFVKLVPDRARVFRVALVPGLGSPVIDDAGDLWLTLPRQLARVSAGSGSVQLTARPAGELVGRLGADQLWSDGRALVRHGAGAPRYRLSLPARAERWHVMPGQLGFAAPGLLGWIDPALGQLTRTRRGVTTRAFGPDGAIVSDAKSTALVRPGRDAPAWSITPALATTSTVVLVPGRVVVLAGSALRFIDTYNGQVRGAQLDLAGPLRWLGGGGRLAAIGDGVGRVQLVDVLEGQLRATIEGPGPPELAASTRAGLMVAFAGGDILWIDADGAVVDRTRVLGRPLGAATGPRDSVYVWSDRELAQLTPPEPGHPRDVEGLLRLAEAVAATGELRGALAILDALAREAAGRVGAAESQRASLLDALGFPALATLAREKAAAVEDLRRPLDVGPTPPLR